VSQEPGGRRRGTGSPSPHAGVKLEEAIGAAVATGGPGELASRRIAGTKPLIPRFIAWNEGLLCFWDRRMRWPGQPRSRWSPG